MALRSVREAVPARTGRVFRLVLGSILVCGAGCPGAADYPPEAVPDAGSQASREDSTGPKRTRDAGEAKSDAGESSARDAGSRDERDASEPRDVGEREPEQERDAASTLEPSSTPITPTAFVYTSGYGGELQVWKLDAASGALTAQSELRAGGAPSYLAFAPDRRHLYAIDEANGGDSSVIAYSIDPQTGGLTELDREPSGGRGAPHLAVHPSGKWLAVAHASSGNTTILPIATDGTLGPVSEEERGLYEPCEGAHQVVFDAKGAHLLVPCLRSDFVIQFDFDADQGELSYADPAFVTVDGGPRHIALSADEKHAYVLSETASRITSFDYDAATGRLSSGQVIDGYAMTRGESAHIAVHPSGRFLYTTNAAENTLGRFTLDAMGRPSEAGYVRDALEQPRAFSVDPSGKWLFLANQAGAQSVHVYSIAEDGVLTRRQVVAAGGNQSFVGLLMLP